jgi:membrane protein required for colicin V production
MTALAEGMNTLDIIMTAIICVTTVSGLWKGMVKQVFSLGGVILGYIVAMEYYVRLSHFVPSVDDEMKKIISFVVIFISFILAASVAGWSTERLLKNADLNWANRAGGGLIGFLKGVLIVVIITVLLLAFLPADSGILQGSKLLPCAVTVSKTLGSVIPKDIKDRYYKKVDEITSRWLREKAREKLRKEAESEGH